MRSFAVRERHEVRGADILDQSRFFTSVSDNCALKPLHYWNGTDLGWYAIVAGWVGRFGFALIQQVVPAGTH
jgi:hypothetical protein